MLKPAIAVIVLSAAAAPLHAAEPATDTAAPESRSAADGRLDLAPPASGRHAEPAVPTTILGLPRNMGGVDRALRIVLALALVGVGTYRLASDSPGRGLSLGMIGFAALPAAIGAAGYCPLYALLGISTAL